MPLSKRIIFLSSRKCSNRVEFWLGQVRIQSFLCYLSTFFYDCVIDCLTVVLLFDHLAVDDELVKVVRSQNPTNSDGDDFTVETLSAVRFAPLLPYPAIETVIPARVWSPSEHHFYPDNFRMACKELLLCSNAKTNQEPVKPQPQQQAINAASLLPKALWVEVLSYTHRDCKYHIFVFLCSIHFKMSLLIALLFLSLLRIFQGSKLPKVRLKFYVNVCWKKRPKLRKPNRLESRRNENVSLLKRNEMFTVYWPDDGNLV